MVIWFNVKETREYLLKNGRVYTLRPKIRREGKEILSYNGFGKKGLVYVSFVKEIENLRELEEFVEDSGFESVAKWIEKAKESRFLYYVFTINERRIAFKLRPKIKNLQLNEYNQVSLFAEGIPILGYYNPKTKTMILTKNSFWLLLHETLHHISNLIDFTKDGEIYNFATQIIDSIL